MPVRNPSFEKVYTEKQWSKAREAAGLKGQLTEKVSVGKELTAFHRTRDVAAAQKLLGKLGDYTGILKTKHAKEKYYAKLLNEVEGQKRLLMTGIKFADSLDDVFAEARQHAVDAGDRAAKALPQVAAKRVFSDDRQRIVAALEAVQKDAIELAESLAGQATAVPSNVTEKIAHLDKRTKAALEELAESNKAVLAIKKRANAVEMEAGTLRAQAPDVAQSGQSQRKLEKMLSDVHAEAKKLYDELASVPAESRATIAAIEAAESHLVTARAEYQKELESRWKDADDHWSDVIAPRIAAIVNNALNEFRDVVLAVRMDELVKTVMAPLRTAHAQEFDPAAVKLPDGGMKPADPLTKRWFDMAKTLINEAIGAVLSAKESSHLFDYVPAPKPKSGGKPPTKKEFKVDRPEGQDDDKNLKSLASHIAKAPSPEAVAKILGSKDALSILFPQNKTLRARIHDYGIELTKAILTIDQSLGANPPDLKTASKSLRENINAAWSLFDSMPQANLLKKAMQSSAFAKLADRIAAKRES